MKKRNTVPKQNCLRKQKLFICVSCVCTLKSALSVVIKTTWKAGTLPALLVKYPIDELAWSIKDESKNSF